MEIAGGRARRFDSILVSALAASLMLHLLAGLLARALEHAAGLPAVWFPQLYGLIAASFGLNLVSLAAGNTLVQFFLLGLRVLVFVLIGLPLASNTGVELCLQTALLIDFAAHSPRALGAAFSLALVAAAWLAQRPMLAWGVSLPAPAFEDALALSGSGLATLALAQAVFLLRSRWSGAEGRLHELGQVVDKLTDANLGFQKYAATIGKSSVLEERNRLSREVHDTIGYTLTNLIIMLEACQDLAGSDPAGLRLMLLKAGELAQDGLADTRRALHALRQAGVEELRGLRAIKKMVDAFQNATGIPVGIEYGNIPWNMDERVDLAVFRLLQEGMTNAFKHGKAGKIQVSFWKTESELMVNIRDNGSGSKEIKEGIGISGMRERIEGLGGEILARNTTDGFELSARIPVNAGGEERP